MPALENLYWILYVTLVIHRNWPYILQFLGAQPPDPCIWDLFFQHRNSLLKILAMPLPDKGSFYFLLLSALPVRHWRVFTEARHSLYKVLIHSQGNLETNLFPSLPTFEISKQAINFISQLWYQHHWTRLYTSICTEDYSSRNCSITMEACLCHSDI